MVPFLEYVFSSRSTRIAVPLAFDNFRDRKWTSLHKAELHLDMEQKKSLKKISVKYTSNFNLFNNLNLTI